MTGGCGPYLADTMKRSGYRTFGAGKFHTSPWDENLGYDVHLHSEELYATPDQRARDSYAAWVRTARPAYNFIEGLMGERTEMYYMLQMSPMPADATVEGWAARRGIEQIGRRGKQPYFGFVSFVGPHPPFAPPIPFDRLYDPDRLPNPIRGEREVDHMDAKFRCRNRLGPAKHGPGSEWTLATSILDWRSLSLPGSLNGWVFQDPTTGQPHAPRIDQSFRWCF